MDSPAQVALERLRTQPGTVNVRVRHDAEHQAHVADVEFESPMTQETIVAFLIANGAPAVRAI